MASPRAVARTRAEPAPRLSLVPSTDVPTGSRSLMERIREGDERAMEEVIERWWVPLTAYAEELTGCADTAEDVIQEVMLTVWDRRTRWMPTDRLQGLLYRMTRNRALNNRRWRLTRDRILRRLPDLTARPRQPDEVLSESRVAAGVRKEIDRLPSRRREIFLLARYHGLAYTEIAETMDISPQTVANQMSRALASLRKALHQLHDEVLTGR